MESDIKLDLQDDQFTHAGDQLMLQLSSEEQALWLSVLLSAETKYSPQASQRVRVEELLQFKPKPISLQVHPTGKNCLASGVILNLFISYLAHLYALMQLQLAHTGLPDSIASRYCPDLDLLHFSRVTAKCASRP